MSSSAFEPIRCVLLDWLSDAGGDGK